MSSPLLTQEKAAWQRQFNKGAITGPPINVNAGVVEWYAAELQKLVETLVADTSKETTSVFKTLATDAPKGKTASMDASLASQARIAMNGLKQRFLRLAASKARRMAASMLLRTDKASAAALHGSLKELSGGLSISTKTMPEALKEAVKATVGENVRLIRSIAAEHLNKVEGAVSRSIISGNGLADLVPELEKIGDTSRARARLIAVDQTKKANTAFTKHRMQAAGITKFKWLHSGGSRVPRAYHRNVLNGQVFSLADPPVIDEVTGEKGLPGQLVG